MNDEKALPRILVDMGNIYSKSLFARCPCCVPCVKLAVWCVCSGLVTALVGQAHAADGATTVEQKEEVITNSSKAATYALGSWIWTAKTYDGQNCHLLKPFEIPHRTVVTNARILIAVDDKYTLLLDGRVLGRGSVWQHLDEYDVTELLAPGAHVLAIQGFNELDRAGAIFGLSIEFADGQRMAVCSDASWRVVPETRQHWEIMTHPPADWPKATVVASFLSPPWWTTLPSVVPHALDKPVVVPFWQTGWFQIMLLVLCGIVILICIRLMTQLAFHRKAQNLLRLERTRIARDLHDDIGAGLTQLVLSGEIMRSKQLSDIEMRLEIDQICENAHSLLRGLGEILWVVNSRHDILPDFATHTFKYAQSFLQTTQIRCRLDVEAELPKLTFDLPIRRNLFLAVKEAINNVAKHAEATELFLRIRRCGQGLEVIIEDNGKGFDPGQVNLERNGLRNMVQRMREVGGQCHVSRSKSGGCLVQFSVPVIHLSEHSKWWKLLFDRYIHRGAKDKISNMASDASPSNSKET